MSPAKDGGRITPSSQAKKPATRAVKQVKKTKPADDNSPDSPVSTTDSSPEATEAVRHPFAVRRLDDLLDGGLKEGTFTLLYGPPFLGKEHLAHLLVVSAMKRGIPTILIHTDGTNEDIQEQLTALNANTPEHAKAGLVQYIDCYSRPIDADESVQPNVHYVDGPMDLNGINLAVNEAQKRLQVDHDHHLVVIDSLSTIIAYSDAQTAFRFLQVLLGKDRRVGGTSLVIMDQGMHSEDEVQMMRHLMSGSIDMRDHNGKFQLKVQGITTQETLNWIDYRYQQGRFEVTGSFAPGRIR